MRYLTIPLIALSLIAPVPAMAQTWVDVFNPFQVLTLNLEMEQTDWDTIRHDTTNEIEVPARFWADGEEDTRLLVSVRRKSSRALPSEADPIKVGLKVDINEFASGQRWRSLTKLSLENGADTDPISEGLAWNLHEKATGPGFYPSDYHAGLAAWVRLFVNGQHPAFRARYNAIMTGLLDPTTGPLSETALHDFLDGVEAAVTAALVADPYAGFDSADAAAAFFTGLRGWVSQRIVNVQGQVAANQPPPRSP